MSKNIIHLNPEAILTELKDLVKNSIEETLNAMLDAEADRLVNAERYARNEERQGYRAGHYERKFGRIKHDVYKISIGSDRSCQLPLRERGIRSGPGVKRVTATYQSASPSRRELSPE